MTDRLAVFAHNIETVGCILLHTCILIVDYKFPDHFSLFFIDLSSDQMNLFTVLYNRSNRVLTCLEILVIRGYIFELL